MKEKAMNSLKSRQAGIAGQIALAGLLSVAVLLICSKNSPLYPMNDWVDRRILLRGGIAARHALVLHAEQ